MLAIQGLKKTYAGPDGATETILDVPVFSLGAGEQVALRGVSGSGKTTFLHLIAGLLSPDAGSVEIEGVDIASLDEGRRDRLRAGKIGYVFQAFNLLQGHTVLENVLLGMSFGSGMDRGRACDLLARVGLAGHARHYPRQLSTGQQQRVAVARALANRPRLVLADEPTGNLDPHHAGLALALVREISREAGAALLLVSHDDSVLSRFEEVRDFAVVNRAAPGRILK